VQVACIFHSLRKGHSALAKTDGQCVVCSHTRMADMCSSAQLRGCLVRHLRVMRATDAAIYNLALRRVPAEWRMVVAYRVRAEVGQEGPVEPHEQRT
jgi:hypothetical protein